MRLMPKDIKNNSENAPLSVARERVRGSWKILKQSLYYFSLNAKSKSGTADTCDKDLLYQGENSQHLDLQLKDEQDISVDSLVDQNVKSFLNDSDGYDGIGELLEKYRYELYAFNRLKSKLHHEDVASEFSELSSISELSLSSDSDDDTQTIISEFTHADLQILQNRLSFKDFYHYPPDTISSNNKSLSTSSSTLSAKGSPFHTSTTTLKAQHNLSNDKNLPPPERARAIFKPLPCVMKPSFVPDMSTFDNGDLSNILMAQASSVTCSKRNTSRKNSEENRFKNHIKKFDKSGITQEPVQNTLLDNTEDTLENIDFENISKVTVEKVDCNTNPSPKSNIVYDNTVSSTKTDTIGFTKNDCLPFQQLFNKKRNIKKKKDGNSDELFVSNCTQHMKSDSVKGKNISNRSTSYSRVDTQCTTTIDNRLHHTRPINTSEPCVTETCKYNNVPYPLTHDTSYRQPSSAESLIKPLNISKSTMVKYPHIFANYLSFQHDPFHSLPNLTTKMDIPSASLPSFNSENFVNKSIIEHSNEDTEKSSNSYLVEKQITMNKNFTNENLSNGNRMIDENYFVIYPEMSEKKIICGNPPCSKEQVPREIERPKFTSCPSCFICYCSRTCRHCHWPEHKGTCLVGFVNFYVHTFFRRCEKDSYINGYLRKLAYAAYQIFGRGCLTISFKSPSDIEYDASSPGSKLSTQPLYKDFKKILSENKSHRHLHMLCQNIKDYDPDQEFVLDIFVCMWNPNTQREDISTSVVRSARISMLKSLKPDYGDSILSYGIRTFSLPTSFHHDQETDVETRRYYCKEIAFGLKRYGVHLKSEYPEAYEKLYRYIDEEVLFTPIILYGKRNNRNYKCILYSGEVKKSHEYGEGAFV